MSDPFAEFKQGQPPVEGDPPLAKEKKKRKIPPKKGATNGTAPVKEAAPASKKERKARKPRATKEMRLPISTLLEIGSLNAQESGLLLVFGADMQKLPKKSRQKITAALGKIFG
jgi:hypothetical protein